MPGSGRPEWRSAPLSAARPVRTVAGPARNHRGACARGRAADGPTPAPARRGSGRPERHWPARRATAGPGEQPDHTPEPASPEPGWTAWPPSAATARHRPASRARAAPRPAPWPGAAGGAAVPADCCPRPPRRPVPAPARAGAAGCTRWLRGRAWPLAAARRRPPAGALAGHPLPTSAALRPARPQPSQPPSVSPLLHQQRIDPLETTRQLVAAPPPFTLVVLQVIRLERQGTIAGLQHQGRPARQHHQVGEVFLAAGDPLAGDADDLVALALAQLRQVAHREQQQPALGGHGGQPVLLTTVQRLLRQHPRAPRQARSEEHTP